MRLIPSTYCQVFRSIYYDSAELLSTISHIQMLWFLKWLQVTSSGSLKGNYQHIPAMSFSGNIISLSTAHVFAIRQDYIELFLELPGEPLKRTLKEGGSWQVPWTRSIESITLPWNTRSLTSWCFCSNRWVRPVSDACVLVQIARIKIAQQGEVPLTRRTNRAQWIGSRLQCMQFFTFMNLEVHASTVEIVVTLNNVIWLPNDDFVRRLSLL